MNDEMKVLTKKVIEAKKMEELYGNTLQKIVALVSEEKEEHKVAFGNQGSEYEKTYDEIVSDGRVEMGMAIMVIVKDAFEKHRAG